MPVNNEQDGPAAKRCRVVGYVSVGKKPKEFLNGEHNIAKMVFHIHDFANRKEKRGEYIVTPTIKAHGHLWKLEICPHGNSNSNTVVEHVSIYLVYEGKNTRLDPVVARAVVRTKSINKEFQRYEFQRYEYSNEKESYVWSDFSTREDIIEKDCDDAGTLTITVELQVATEKRSVWYPRLTSCDYTRLYKSVETSDVTVMAGTKEFQLHKCVLADRTRVLYELVRTEEETSSSSEKNNCIVVLADVDGTVFEILIEFVYSGEQPKLNDLDEATIKSILVAANRLGVTQLKLYVESILVEKFLVPSKAAAFLLFADSYSCGFLKEKSMDMYGSNSKEVMESHEDWTKLKESNDLLVELLVYANTGRKKYSSVVDDGKGTIDDVDGFDVTSLRERLEKVDLDVDGSREILVERWKNDLRANDNKEEVEVEEEELETEEEIGI